MNRKKKGKPFAERRKEMNKLSLEQELKNNAYPGR